MAIERFFRPFASDKIKCYNFESTNFCIYINSDQDRCINCLDSDLISNLRKRCIRVVEIRTNDNTVRSHIKNQWIVGSHLLVQDKVDFMAKKAETISISQRKLANNFTRNNAKRMVDYLFFRTRML